MRKERGRKNGRWQIPKGTQIFVLGIGLDPSLQAQIAQIRTRNRKSTENNPRNVLEQHRIPFEPNMIHRVAAITNLYRECWGLYPLTCWLAHMISWSRFTLPLEKPHILNRSPKMKEEKGHKKRWESFSEAIPQNTRLPPVIYPELCSLSLVESLPPIASHWIMVHLGIWNLNQTTFHQATAGLTILIASQADLTEKPWGLKAQTTESSWAEFGIKELGVFATLPLSP